MNKKLIKELEPLTIDEKLDIIEFLSGSIASNDLPLSDSQRAMVREREVAYKTGSTSLFSWEEVRNSTIK